ncbi:MAG: LUD domain-containing protein [Lachnospiraceae bacterium]|nr:LUD domain-containing protein [Lachnospiraceae bacterium]
MNESRQIILDTIRRSTHGDFPLPDVPSFAIPGDAVENFISNLESFDGKAVTLASRQDAIKWLEKNIRADEKIIFSALNDFSGNFPIKNVEDPHNAHVIDICIGEGKLGVGESGSVWVTDTSLGKAACALMSTDLYLLLDRTLIVPGMHEAYRKINLRAEPYGSFFSGPSATADIEAVRVTGAQGEISLTVLIYG